MGPTEGLGAAELLGAVGDRMRAETLPELPLRRCEWRRRRDTEAAAVGPAVMADSISEADPCRVSVPDSV